MSFFDPSLSAGEPPEMENDNLLLAAQESGYIAPDVEGDQDAIAQQVFVNLAARVNGWQSHDGNLDTWLIEAFSEVGAEIRSLAADVPASIFGTYGTRVLGVPPRLATGASGTASFTAQDDAGYTLDTGTTFGLSRSGNDVVAFQTLQEATIAPGDTLVADVPFTAVEVGAASNGLVGVGQMLDPVTWVAAINVPIATTGGQDAELPDDYVDRLSNLFPAVGLRPVLPQDFAILALQLIPGVGRAVAMNLYDPGTDTWDNVRTVTLVIAQADGTPCSATVKAQVEALLEALREVNWVVHVIDPLYQPVDVTFVVTPYAGQDLATVVAACVANVTSYLSPGAYRLGELSPAIAGGEVIYPPANGTEARRQVVRVNELISLLDRSLGVDYVNTVEINGVAGDFAFGNAYTLPTAGTIVGNPASDPNPGPPVFRIDSITPADLPFNGNTILTLTGEFPVPFPADYQLMVEPENDKPMASPGAAPITGQSATTATVMHGGFGARDSCLGPALAWILADDWTTVVSNQAPLTITTYPG